jgi:hypothetical protein
MIMKQRFIMVLALALALVAACNKTETSAITPTGDKTTEVAKSHEMTPEMLGELGAEIEKNPDNAKQLLSEHGLDEKSFEVEIRKITEDPEASKRYAAAYEKAKA